MATGLDETTTLVFDTVNGNLLVAESSQITVIPRTELESDLVALARGVGDLPGAAPQAGALHCRREVGRDRGVRLYGKHLLSGIEAVGRFVAW